MKIFLFTLLFILLCIVAIPNTVYVVLSSDTSIWTNTSGSDDAYTYANEFDFDVFANPNGVYHDVFDSTFRTTHTDSLGYPFKVTWFMHGGGWFQEGTNSNSTTTMYQIRKYWQDELDYWGDALEYHFHHFKWTGSQWAQAPTFAETIWDYEWTTSQMVIDESLYPVSFRSGWNYMDNPYQQYLELWLPFRMEGGSYMTDCTPYHPSNSDYRVPGTMKGWEVRHVYMKNFTVSFANQVFNVARQGKDQVVCIWSHQNEADYVSQIAFVDTNLHSAATTYPDVQFLYCTAKEAMQKWLQTSDSTPPTLNLSTEKLGNTINVTITTDPNIYQLQPYVAAREYTDEYIRLDTAISSSDTYYFSYSTSDVDRADVVVSDEYGNVSMAEVKDGSHRWATQAEFYYSNPQDVDVDSLIDKAILTSSTERQTIVNQPNYNASTGILNRSYWLGQTFVPQSDGISKVVFAANVTQASQFRVELRPLLPSGFPDDNPSGLLAYGNATINASGTGTASLNYTTGLQRDGRSYVLLFKFISGSARLWINTLNPYPNGILIRAYSLDWITIPDFDLYFQIYDEFQNLSINQATNNSFAYNSEKGFFVAQTFQLTNLNLSDIEINVTNSSSSETIDVQLRKTLPDGSPDFSYDALLNKKNFSITSAGIQNIPLDWTLSSEYLNDTLAFVFAGPQASTNSIQLAYNSTDAYSDGKLFFSNDLVDVTDVGGDLYLKLYSNVSNYVSSGTLTMQYDAGTQAYWNKAEMTKEIPTGTSIRYRFRFANTSGDLNTAPWSDYYSTSPVYFQPNPYYCFVETEVLLESSGLNTPVLDSLELFYNSSPSCISDSIWLLM